MPASRPSRDKVRAYRERLRRQGLRPLQIWVPDVRSPGFAAEAHRQSLAVANSPYARENQDFIDLRAPCRLMADKITTVRKAVASQGLGPRRGQIGRTADARSSWLASCE